MQSEPERAGLPRMSLTAILGARHDHAVKNALLWVLRELGAQEDAQPGGVHGPHEASTSRFLLGGNPLTVEAEPYYGLTVTGDRETVEKIVARVREIVGRR
jgi:hypothetical protein